MVLMMTHCLTLPPTTDGLQKAAALLKEGKLVSFPTETVYGLGGIASSDQAIAAIYEAKKRPNFNPLIAHVHSLNEAKKLASFSETALELAEIFWPGPMTLILPRSKECSASLLASAGLETIAIRFPAHPIALKLLEYVGEPVCAPSANLSGQVSPTTPVHVLEGLKDRISAVITAGKCQIGVESTIIDLTAERPRILRFGGITPEDLVAVLGENKFDLIDEVNEENPSAPGQLKSHYAPDVPVRLNALSPEKNESFLAFGPILQKGSESQRVLNLSESGDLNEAAANLFAMLRTLDKTECSGIAVMPIPETGLGLAINDRLRRAAAPR